MDALWERTVRMLAELIDNLGWDLTWWAALAIVAEAIALVTIPSVLIERRGQPTAALAWVLAMIGLPFFGVMSWWMIGRSHLKRKKRKRARAKALMSHAGGTGAAHGVAGGVPPAGSEPPFLNFEGVYPFAPGCAVKVLIDGGETYREMEGLIQNARSSLDLLFYTWRPDRTGERFRDMLKAKAQAGVQVRVLCDAMGSGSASGSFMDPLREAGGKVVPFMPTKFFRRSLTINFRNHRKIAIADCETAYTGGLNIGDEHTSGWRDFALLLKGPVVSQLGEVFAEDWFFATGENLLSRATPSQPGPDEANSRGGGWFSPAYCSIIAGGPDTLYNATHDAFFIAVNRAKERIWITTPYLIPSGAIQTALRTAVFKGVDVRLLVPAKSDNPLTRLAGRSYYPSLLPAGIRIFEYLPGILHGKMWLFDSDLSVVGSANLDIRSFKLNFETSCFVRNADLNRELSLILEGDIRQSAEMTMASLSRRKHSDVLLEAVMNLFSPLM